MLAKMETKQAEELLMKFQENMTEISEEMRKMAVWSMMWLVAKRKEEQRENEVKGKPK